MVKLYCDRCGKEVERFNERRYKPIDDAANGDDKFFVVDVFSKHTYERLRHKVGEEERYEFNSPDLCVDCMRKINEAIKTVWDGTPNWEKEAES